MIQVRTSYTNGGNSDETTRSIAALCALAAMPAPADLVHSANTTVGNQAWSAVGLEFIVNPGPGIVVTDLGIYDHLGDGIISGTDTQLSTLLFSTGNPASLAQMNFTAAAPGLLDGTSNYLFKPLATPLILAPGSYTIMGYGFNGGNLEHNSNIAPPGPTFDPTGGGLITFVRPGYTDPSGAVPAAVGLAGSALGGGYTDPWEYDPVNDQRQSLAEYADTPDTASGQAGGPLPATAWPEMLIGSDVNLNLGDDNGYALPLVNDEDDLWYTRLYMATGSYWSGWSTSRPGTQSVLPLDFTALTGLANGKAVGLDRVGGHPGDSRAFPISGVPVPGAVLLGLLGLAAAGLRLRKLT